MDDIGKALIMATNVLLFVVACTVSIYLYNSLTNNVESIFLSSDYSNQGDSISNLELVDAKRKATKAEVVMAILDLKDKYKKTNDSEYAVVVAGKTYKYDSENDAIVVNNIASYKFNSSELKNELYGLGTEYNISYNETSKILEYN